MAAYGNPDPKKNTQWAGLTFHRRLAVTKLPLRRFVRASHPLLALKLLLEQDQIAVQIWEDM